MLAHLKAVADSLGLPFGERRMTFNSRRAQELGKWAEARNRGEAFHRAVFHAYFARGRNIAQPEVLLDMAASVGLEAAAAREILDTREFSQAVDADWQRAYQMGITAVPTFQIQGRQLVGAQPYQALEALVRGAEAAHK